MSSKRLKVLIVGGYGSFGGRLARLLSNDPRADILVAGRSLQQATRFCQSVNGSGSLTPAAFDRAGDVAAQLSALGPDVVVDASGPWQAYGDDPYRLACAAIRGNAHYIDIADGREFVQNIIQLDDDARSRGVAVLSGASTCPALSGAVCRQLCVGLRKIHRISGGIAPSPFVPMGRSVLEAIAGYAGKPLEVWRDGRRATEMALVSNMSYTIAPPGVAPLPRMQFLLVDVPDLDLLQEQSAPVEAVWFGVATRPAVFQHLLRWISAGVSRGFPRSLRLLAPAMQFVTNRIQWGEHRGGMFVEVAGETAAGVTEKHAWHLVAEGDAGPNIPLLAAVILIRRMLDGQSPPAGARPAVDEFALADFESLFTELGIHTGRRMTGARREASVFRKVLGCAWETLPKEIRDAHSVSGKRVLAGSGRVLRGSSVLSRLAGWIIGLPNQAQRVNVRVSMQVAGGVETWRRDFDGHQFSSTLQVGRGRWDGHVVERFGPISIAMALIVDGSMLRYVPRRMSIFGIPLPTLLLPHGDLHERVVDGRFCFHVDVHLPVAGHVVTYEGTLSPEA